MKFSMTTNGTSACPSKHTLKFVGRAQGCMLVQHRLQSNKRHIICR
jgi:hypothetical protein